MREILPNNARTNRMLNKCPKLYAVGFWVKYGIREYYFSGKCDATGAPLVWMYNDHNGEREEWILMDIYCTTSGRIVAWTTTKNNAVFIANVLNKQARFDREGV